MTLTVLPAGVKQKKKAAGVIKKSLRLRASASAYLNRTPASASNRQIWTWSGWVKRGLLGSQQMFFSANTNAGTDVDHTDIRFSASDTILMTNDAAAVQTVNLNTTQVFRDPSAWYHIVIAIDTTQATASNRIKFYVNGAQITAFGTASYPAQNASLFINNNINHRLASYQPISNYFDGYLTEVNFIDGQALTPSSFGEIDASTGVWTAKKYAGTYGTNGFRLNFEDNSNLTALGYDSSGNNNHWTPNNISLSGNATYDSMNDVPAPIDAAVGNFATLNPLVHGNSALTNGNLTSAGTTNIPTIIPSSGTYYFEVDGVSKTWTPPAAFPSVAGNYNFGQRPFNNAPTGLLLQTFNLPDSAVPIGNTEMDALIDTGVNIKTKAEALYVGSQFLEWIKDRANANNHQLIDSVRGLSKVLQSNTTSAETTYAAPVGNSVAWVWKSGGAPIANNDGSIASTVSANKTAGFSVVTWTGNLTNSTVGHGLGVAPQFIIVKNRTTANLWTCYHASATASGYLALNTDAAYAATSVMWNNTAPTSSVFTVGTTGAVNNTGDAMVAYCWTPIAGYSAFGSYTGTANADGQFVYTGFRPKFVMVKGSSFVCNWFMLDSARNTYNALNSRLASDASYAEDINAAYAIDFLSNGFKLRSSSNVNASGTYIYMAFAENPFKHSLAR